MDRHPNDRTTNAEIDAALEEAKLDTNDPLVVEAAYRAEPGLEFLMLKLSDGRRLLIPREDLGELKDATPQQAAELFVLPDGAGIWWPKLDDGLYLPDFLERRWHRTNPLAASSPSPNPTPELSAAP